MYWSIKRSRNARPQLQRRRANRARRLSGEALEPRLALDGTVLVTLSGTTLTLEGDIDANDVLIRKGPNPNEILIEGKDRDGNVTTFINGPTLIDDPVSEIDVDLYGGSDDFRIEGNSRQDRFVVPGPLYINNYDGDDVNRLENVLLASTLNIAKVAGNSESTLEVVGTDVVGAADINNNIGGEGPSKTMITSGSTFQNDVDITNGDGKDILVVDNSNIDGNLCVDNGDGDTRTVFGMSEDPIVFGDVDIDNGLGNDTYVLNDTDVWGAVYIDNGDGHSDTTVANARVGLGKPVAIGSNVFDLQNGAGIDTFLMTESVINDTLEIQNANNFADTYGSTTDISDSTIHGNLRVSTDGGYDRVTIDSTVIGLDLALLLYDGSSNVALADLTIGSDLRITTDYGRDEIVMERTTVTANTDIEIGNGIDRLEILAGSKLLGQTSLDGGPGVDTFVRQLGPGAQAVDIVFLWYEVFELDEFVF